MKYVAVIFDVIGSRKYNNRQLLQQMLMDCVDYLNIAFRDGIKKDVIVSSGDEFQGLFLNIQTAYAYLRKLQMLIFPIQIRCGMGFGEIKYDHDDWQSTAFDGDAYYYARDAVNSLNKKTENEICIFTMSKCDQYINSFISASLEAKRHQTNTTNIINILADIIMPISSCNEEMLFYCDLMRVKSNFNHYNNKALVHMECDIDFEKIFKIRSSDRYLDIHADKSNNAFQFRPNEYWIHGMSTDIARAMNIKRQTVDRRIKYGRIKECRTIDKYIYDLFSEGL